MESIGTQTAAVVQDRTITVQDFLRALKSEGLLPGLIERVCRGEAVRHLAKVRGITATPEELQRAADAVRTAAGLHKADATLAWLKSRGMTESDFEQSVTATLLERKLQDQVAAPHVERVFAEHKARFDRARLAQIVVDSIGLAQELVFRLREESADFAALAARHSLDEGTRDNAGYLGLVGRGELSTEMAEAVFAARPGDVLGPFPLGDHFAIVQVREVRPARLDEQASRAIRTGILNEVLAHVAHQNGALSDFLGRLNS